MLHIPTTWQSLREFYSDLKNGRLASATQVSFFLGVFAGSVYASKNDFQFETSALQSYPQKVLAERWVKQAVILLTNPPVPPSVRALQTFVTLAHLCMQIEGLSGSFGILSVTGLQMARNAAIGLKIFWPSAALIVAAVVVSCSAACRGLSGGLAVPSRRRVVTPAGHRAGDDWAAGRGRTPVIASVYRRMQRDNSIVLLEACALVVTELCVVSEARSWLFSTD
jgi:hypothetical protein